MDNTTKQSILGAIWILSCLDKIPQMTYRDIKTRIVIPEGVDIKEIVKSKTELFRIGIPEQQLETWKGNMKAKKTSIPTWIANSENREEEIDKIKKEDLFRNRFRNSLKAPTVPIEILQWGLSHIDQMFDLQNEAKERSLKIWTTIVIPVVSLLLAFSSVYFSFKSIRDQKQLKKYELSLNSKQEGYTEFMGAIFSSYLGSVEKNKAVTINELNNMITLPY